jgi:release factor glutamine methyltransferase
MRVEGLAQTRPSDWLDWGIGELGFLEEAEARRECEVMLETLLGVSRAEVYLASEFDPQFLPQLSAWVQARKQRVPLAYLLGKAPFWDDEFEVEEGVLIPRPETETLIEAFLNVGGFNRSDRFRFLDLGTGSGNIAVTIAKLFPQSQGLGSDLSGKALAVAKRNAERLGASERMSWIQGDGLGSFEKERFDVIFSNPPYVASQDIEQLAPEVKQEPRLALDGGEDGLDFYRRIFRDLTCLSRGGSLWVEIGEGQRLAVQSLFDKERFRNRVTFQDLLGIHRVVGGIGWNG